MTEVTVPVIVKLPEGTDPWRAADILEKMIQVAEADADLSEDEWDDEDAELVRQAHFSVVGVAKPEE